MINCGIWHHPALMRLAEEREDESMTALPIVQRELRVLARKPATYRWRWIIGGVAFGIALLLILAMGAFGGPKDWGSALFTTLTIYAATVCLLAGVFGTADILSEERREGTLGLLFLTDLKGYDVVFGKFSAVALNAIYWLLALIPVLSLPLLIGGVTFGELVRASLALMNLLFVTMTVGTFVSVGQTQTTRSLVVSVGLLLIICLFLPALFAVLGWNQTRAVMTFSPTLALVNVDSVRFTASPDRYWHPLFSSHLLGWLLLACATWRLPRVWQQPVNETGAWGQRRGNGRTTTFDQRAKWMDPNPAILLMRADRGIRLTALILALLGGVIIGLDLLWANGGFGLKGTIPWLLLVPLKVLLAIHACRFFSAARQSGVFELLLSTPLTVREILAAHWSVIHRTFLFPGLVLLIYVIFESIGVLLNLRGPNSVFLLFTTPITLVNHVMDYFLLGWMGAWMGLKLKRPGWAPFLTLLFALVLPSLLCGLAFLIKPVLIAVARHYVTYEFPRLVRREFVGDSRVEAPVRMGHPPPLP